MPKKKDLTGLRVGRLVVQYELPVRKNGRIMWHCQCDCGNEKDIASSSLATGRTQSCGCLQKERTREASQLQTDLTGTRYGKLVVLRRLSNSSLWECLCDCGNKTTVSTNHLNSGHTQSCGCLQKERTREACRKDISGQRFGMLTAIEIDEENSLPKKVKWKCRCDCGTIKSFSRNNLMSGECSSCGCKRFSKGEAKIVDLLNKEKIPFEHEKTFPDCKSSKTNKNYRYDFYVNNSYLIEFHGQQHFSQSQYFTEPLEDVEFRDAEKVEWAKANNIPLIVIPYTKLDTLSLNDIQLTTSQFLVH